VPHLPPTHHETSKHDFPNEIKIKEKQNETIPVKSRQVNDSSQSNQKTDHLVSQNIFKTLELYDKNSQSLWIHTSIFHKYMTIFRILDIDVTI
jgi:hypothetical protein